MEKNQCIFLQFSTSLECFVLCNFANFIIEMYLLIVTHKQCLFTSQMLDSVTIIVLYIVPARSYKNIQTLIAKIIKLHMNNFVSICVSNFIGISNQFIYFAKKYCEVNFDFFRN